MIVHALMIAGAAYLAVLTAELVGDKSLVTIASLTSRHRAASIVAGLVPAQMIKVGAAVLAGGLLMRVPRLVLITLSVATFAAAAVLVWRMPEDERAAVSANPRPRARNGAVLAFSTVFFGEWGDIGQLTTAMLVARYGMPWLVWVGATSALITKGVLAIAFGAAVRRYVPYRALRLGATAVLTAMALVAANGIR